MWYSAKREWKTNWIILKVRPRFGNELKEKLNDYRCQIITLDEIIKYLEKYYKKKYSENNK